MITRRQIFQVAVGLAVALTPLVATFASGRQERIASLRERLYKRITEVALFEPNDDTTRQAVQVVVEDELQQHALHDYVVVCDETNNAPVTIDRNELWIDVAIQLSPSCEHFYIPIRVIPS